MPDADYEEFAAAEEPDPTHPSMPVGYRDLGYSDEVHWDRSWHLHVNRQRACCTTRWGRLWFRVMGRHWFSG